MKPTINRYKRAGFTVDEVRGDGEFKVIEVFGINLRVCANNEHEPYIERYHRLLQERMRGLLANSAFNKLPKMLIRALTKYSIFYLNHLPWNSGVSKTLSPAYIVSGQRLDYKNHCQLEFLEYVQVHNPSDNTIKPRTSPALNLGPTGNEQDTHRFYNLVSGRVFHRLYWTCVPMPEGVEETIHKMAKKEVMTGELNFEDEDYDTDYVPDPVDPSI